MNLFNPKKYKTEWGKEDKKGLSYPVVWAIMLGNIFLGLISGPVYPVFLAGIVSVFIFLGLRGTGRMSGWKKGDFIKTSGITLLFLILLTITTGISFASVSWPLLIGVAIVVELILFITGFAPIIGDLLGGIFAWLLIVIIIGGVHGFIIGMVFGLISFIIALVPFHIPGLVLISFILIKLFWGMIF